MTFGVPEAQYCWTAGLSVWLTRMKNETEKEWTSSILGCPLCSCVCALFLHKHRFQDIQWGL